MIWAILAIAFFLRLISLNQSLWLDEATSALVARDFGVGEVFTLFIANDFHTPLSYVLQYFWQNGFGSGEVILRLFSVIAGLGSIYLTYLIAKELFAKRVGYLAAAFLATSGLHVYYSQEARAYMLSTFLVTALIYLFLKLMKGGNWKYWALFSVTLVINSFVDYLPNLILPVFWIYALIAKKDKAWWKRFLLAHLPLVVAWFLWMPIFSWQLVGGLGVKTSAPGWWKILGRTNFKELLLVPTKFVLGRISFYNKALYAVVAGGVLFAYLALIIGTLHSTLKKKGYQLIILWLLIPVLLAAALGFWVSVFSYFRLIFVLPALFILLAAAISKLDKKLFVPAVALVFLVNIISTGAYLSNERFHREDWRGFTEFVEKDSGDNYIVLFVADSNMEAYKYYDNSANIAGPDALDGSHETIYLMRYLKDVFDPEDRLRSEIENLGFEKQSEHDFNGIVVWKYENTN